MSIDEAMVAAAALANEAPVELGELPDSPARKGPGRPVRAVKQMGEDKFSQLYEQMAPYKDADPEGYRKVMAEGRRRGY